MEMFPTEVISFYHDIYMLSLVTTVYAQLQKLKKLRQFHCELNPLVPKIPIPADQLKETLSLKVL